MNEIKNKKTGRSEIVSDEELALFSVDLLRRFTVTKLNLRPIIPSLTKEILPEKKTKNKKE